MIEFRMFDSFNYLFTRLISQWVVFIPNLLGALLIFIIGLIIAAILRNIAYTGFYFLKINAFLEKTKVMKQSEVRFWSGILAELLRWIIILYFIPPVFDVLGLGKALDSLSSVFNYMPIAMSALIIVFVGFSLSNIISESVRQALGKVSDRAQISIVATVKTVCMIITVLVALSQLGIAQEFIRILFIGLTAMLSLAGGLAFGLGGRESAQRFIQYLGKKLH